MTRKKKIPTESLISLRLRLDALPAQTGERSRLVQATAELYGVSRDSLYRALREVDRPHSAHRSDKGRPRKLSVSELENYCEVIAALKVRTTNKKGRHLSTRRALQILEEHGVHTPHGLIQPAPGLLNKTTVNRYLKAWGYDHSAVTREPPAVRFQAAASNDRWQFDLSPSDLKHLKTPAWIDPDRNKDPLLMLYSIVDDRSGACYQEYHSVYGEDVEAALKFLFNAMSAKTLEGFGLRGIPKTIYTDNGPIVRSQVFLSVMNCLGVEVLTHLPKGADGRRTTARSKGKVERAFRTVKEAHETLYHFRQPSSESEANEWLHNYLVRYNNQQHRSEAHSRIEDWFQNLPPSGIREMCTWERFCAFAREPEQRTVGNDARITVSGVTYEVEPDLAGAEVTLWWGLFDDGLFVERGDRRFGPFYPLGKSSGGPRYRKFKRTKSEERADRIAALAAKLDLPGSAFSGKPDFEFQANPIAEAKDYQDHQNRQPVVVAFADPDPFQEFTYPNAIFAKRAISEFLGYPLMKLSTTERAFVNSVLAETLNKRIVLERVRDYFHPTRWQNSPVAEVLEEADEYVN